MQQNETVPEYRELAGQYYDEHNRPLRAAANLHFVNCYRLRYGVATLEEFARKAEMQNIVDPGMIELIQEELKVRVVRFCLSPLAVSDVVNTIRNHTLDKVRELEKASA
jgi:hypothetical protein